MTPGILRHREACSFQALKQRVHSAVGDALGFGRDVAAGALDFGGKVAEGAIKAAPKVVKAKAEVGPPSRFAVGRSLAVCLIKKKICHFFIYYGNN